MLWTTKTTLKSDYLLKIKAWAKNNHYTPEGIRESHPYVHDLRHPRLCKRRHMLQIMDTRMGFPCPFRSVVIDSISPSVCRTLFFGYHMHSTEHWFLVPDYIRVFALWWEEWNECGFVGTYPLATSPRNALWRGYSNAPVVPCVRACVDLVNAIETTPLCASSSNLADMLIMIRGWTILILKVGCQSSRS